MFVYFRRRMTYLVIDLRSIFISSLFLYRRDCELMAGELCKGNIAALCYHAGLSDDERSTVQQRWLQEDRCKV